MKKLYKLMAVGALFAGSAATMQAVDFPTTTAGGAPVDGGKYVLVNAMKVTGYMSRTGWDGAFYFNGNTINPAHALTAQDNGDGTWSFYITESNGDKTYVGIPSGTPNLHARANEMKEPICWTIEEGSIEGYYGLRAGEGNADPANGILLHLNAGVEYFVISVPAFPWYPDYAGGAQEEGDGTDDVHVWIEDENGRALMNDHTSENWKFLSIDDIDAYYLPFTAYDLLTQLENEYLELDGFATGFQKTYDDALVIYNAVADMDAQAIIDMVNAKIALYELIVQASDLDADAMLEAAITKAQTTFDTVSDPAAIEAAIAELTEAIRLFQLGGGDYTSFGQNMSFEDLSAQGGSTTTGVAAPPAGWNVFIEGKQVTTAAEVTAAGIGNWHGVNADCAGEAKDGNYGFGIWAAGIPDYEISQTITGIENGTYIVTAGMMVGANNSGSRRTTQRIFGNLNACYFGYSDDYDEEKLNILEVPAYQNNVETVTDTDLSPMELRAYVYDGTLTFGLRTDGNIAAAYRDTKNSAGGDGWFKVDNFRIQKVGYVGEDAANVANYFLEAFNRLAGEPMEANLSNTVDEITSTYDYLDADTPADDINARIQELTALLKDVKASCDAYEMLRQAIDAAYEKAAEYQYYGGYEDFLMTIYDVEDNYSEGMYDLDGVAAAIQRLQEAEDACAKSGIAVGEYMNIIKNPGFEDLSAQGGSVSDGVQNTPAGWDLYIDGEKVSRAPFGGWCAINHGDPINEVDENGTDWTTQYTEGEHLWGIWTEVVPEVQLSQTFTGIPAGTYVLSCDMVVQYNWAGPCVTTQRIFANNYIQMYGDEYTYAEGLNDTPDMTLAKTLDGNTPDAETPYMNYAGYINASQGGATSCPHPMSLRFGVGEDGNLTIGFRTNNVAPDGTVQPYSGAGWFKLDNFRLFYETEDTPTGVSTVIGNAVEMVGRQFFTVDGAQIQQPQRGITIVKNIMSDGSVKVTKVMNK